MTANRASSAPRRRSRAGLRDRVARKVVQLGFLVLFLYPFLPVVYRRVTYKTAPTLSSWLLPWDPLLLLGQVAHREWGALVIGAPLLLLALATVLGRFFCGWVCPLGTLLDLVRPLAFWQRGRRDGRPVGILGRLFPSDTSGTARYFVLAFVLVSAFFTLQFLGVLDPLVIFQRAATVVMADVFALREPVLRLYLSASLIALGILALELWQPRFWCRHLCPLGALLSIPSRWALLNRRADDRCNDCGLCRRGCPMTAIPQEGRDTDYGACHLCLACESRCPRHAISFAISGRAGRSVRVKETPAAGESPLSRRVFVGGMTAGLAGLALPAAVRAAPSPPVLRPPGALPEAQFVRTCVICQECVRVCPTGGLKPVGLSAGLPGAGTPHLVPRLGGCSLYPSCPHLCAQVCPVGAIRPTRVADMKIGRAQVDHAACLAWDQGVKCLVCVEACLFEAAMPFDGRVVVDPNKCTGCGRCEQACPVAGSAIRVYPVAYTNR